MTEAVAYAFHCLGQEGLHTSLKPEEGLIYLYDGRMVGLSSQASVGSTIGSTKTCHNLHRKTMPVRRMQYNTVFYSQTVENGMSVKTVTLPPFTPYWEPVSTD